MNCSHKGLKKMIAQLKELSSYEIDEDLASYTPEVFDNFELTILASIGVNGTEGADLFQFEICTPKSLSDRCEGGVVVAGRGKLIVGHYNYAAIRQYLDRICSQCSGDDWPEIVEKLSRYGLWEFEGYERYS